MPSPSVAHAGALPLHSACAVPQATLETVGQLLEADPSWAARLDEHGRLPLHVAAGAGASVAVLDALLERHPSGCAAPDSRGKLPLHHSASGLGGGRHEGLAYLLRIHPDAASCCDENEHTPLHTAASEAASDEAVRLLLEACPEAAAQRDSARLLPLHHAVMTGASGKVVSLLLSAFPEGARSPLPDGRSPLQCAAESASADSILVLIDAHPPALYILVGGLRPLTRWVQTCGAAEAAARLSDAHAMKPSLLRLIVHELCVFPEMADLMRRAVLTVPELPYVQERSSAPAPISADLEGESAFDEPGSPTRSTGTEAIEVACAPCRAAMLSAGLFLRRYSLLLLPPPVGVCDATPGYLPEPQLAYSGAESGTVVLLAVDTWAEDGADEQFVALKAMKRPDKLIRELKRRKSCSTQYVVPILRSHGLEDQNFSVSEDFDDGGDAFRGQPGHCSAADVAEETQLRGLPRFIAVLPRLDGTLDAAMAARRAQLMHAPQPRDWAAKRHLGNCLANALQHLHSRGLVYGDLRPSNVAYSRGAWLLLDLDGVCRSGEYLSDRIDAAYAPPEAVYLPPDGEPCLRTVAERGLLEAWEPASLRAHPSLDIWALGTLLFEAIVGHKLFPTEEDGSLSSETLRKLAAFDDAALEAALRPLMAEPLDNMAATPGGISPAESRDQVVALMRWLLQPSPSTRPASMESVLKHRFLDPACGLDRDALVRGEASSSLVSALLARVGGKRSSAVLGGAEGAALSGVMGALVPGALGERIWRGFSAALMSYGSGDVGPAGRGEDPEADMEAAYEDGNDEPML